MNGFDFYFDLFEWRGTENQQFAIKILIRRKEKYATSKWVLKNLFCWRSNLSNDDMISARPGQKMVVKNDIFWCEIGSGYGEPGGTALPRIPRSTPTPRPGIMATLLT